MHTQTLAFARVFVYGIRRIQPHKILQAGNDRKRHL